MYLHMNLSGSLANTQVHSAPEYLNSFPYTVTCFMDISPGCQLAVQQAS